MRQFALAVIPLFMSMIGSSQCAISAEFDYVTIPSGIYALYTPQPTECPDAMWFHYQWSLDGTESDELSEEVTFTNLNSGPHELCLQVLAMDAFDQVIESTSYCQVITVVNCDEVFSLFYNAADPENTELWIIGQDTDLQPLSIVWYGDGNYLDETTDPYLIVSSSGWGNTEVSAVITLSPQCTITESRQFYPGAYDCLNSVQFTTEDNLVTTQEYYDGIPIDEYSGEIPEVSFFLEGGIIEWLSDSSFYLPGTGEYLICYSAAQSGTCLPIDVCQELIITSLDQECEAGFTSSNEGYEFTFSQTSSGYFDALAWFVNGEYAGSDPSIFTTFLAGTNNEVILEVSNSQTGCQSSYSEVIVAPFVSELCGIAFLDINWNGLMDSGEQGIEGVVVINDFDNGITATSNVDGSIHLPCFPGAWSVSVILPEGYTFLYEYGEFFPFSGDWSEDDSMCVLNMPIVPNEFTLCGQVFIDTDCDDIWDVNEVPYAEGTIGSEENQGPDVFADWEYTTINGEFCVTCGYPTAYLSIDPPEPFNVDSVTFGFIPELVEDPTQPLLVGWCYNQEQPDLAMEIFAPTELVRGYPYLVEFIVSNQSPILTSGSFTIQFPADFLIEAVNTDGNSTAIINGSTVICEGTENLGYQYPIYWIGVELTPDPDIPLGTPFLISGTITGTPDEMGTNNTTELSGVIIGSYDPNTKHVIVPEADQWGNTPFTTEPFTYFIQFQNTGTAPAYNVMLRDTIDEEFDLQSLEVLASSDSYTQEISGNVVTWYFNNIMLPAYQNAVNESIGWLLYRINTSEPQIGDQFTNTAHIYFDFNEAIITNTTLNIFTIPENVELSEIEAKPLVYPNPAATEVHVLLPEPWPELELSIICISGNSVFTAYFENTSEVFIPIDFPSGIYLLKILTDSATFTTRLFIE